MLPKQGIKPFNLITKNIWLSTRFVIKEEEVVKFGLKQMFKLRLCLKLVLCCKIVVFLYL